MRLFPSTSCIAERICRWKRFLAIAGVEVIERKKKKLTNGIANHSAPGTPATPATPQTAAIDDDLTDKSYITSKELDSLAEEEVSLDFLTGVVSLMFAILEGQWSDHQDDQSVPEPHNKLSLMSFGSSRKSSFSFIKQSAARLHTY